MRGRTGVWRCDLGDSLLHKPVHIRTIGFFEYDLPLDPPFRWRGGEVAEREGVLLRLEDAGGRVGWGDAAPLPGFSRESLAEAMAALEAAAPTLAPAEFDARQVADPESPLHSELDGLALPPAARYALDLALADLAAAEAGTPLPRLLDAGAADRLHIAALIDGEPETVVDRAATRAADGYVALKLKLGRLDVEGDAELVRDVRRRVGGGIELRGDANRAWSPDGAAAFARLTATAGLAYVEEPLAADDAGDLESFARESGLPVALDESLAEDPEREIGSWVVAVVLKPTVLGGIATTLRLATRARAAGVTAVLSAAFESGIGQRGVAALAAATGARAAGLDPYSRLRSDVLARPLPFDQPVVDLAELFGAGVRVTLD